MPLINKRTCVVKCIIVDNKQKGARFITKQWEKQKEMTCYFNSLTTCMYKLFTLAAKLSFNLFPLRYLGAAGSFVGKRVPIGL